jgi:hypothetical protein
MENVFETQQCDEAYMPTQEDWQEYVNWLHQVEETESQNETEFHKMESCHEYTCVQVQISIKTVKTLTIIRKTLT